MANFFLHVQNLYLDDPQEKRFADIVYQLFPSIKIMCSVSYMYPPFIKSRSLIISPPPHHHVSYFHFSALSIWTSLAFDLLISFNWESSVFLLLGLSNTIQSFKHTYTMEVSFV